MAVEHALGVIRGFFKSHMPFYARCAEQHGGMAAYHRRIVNGYEKRRAENDPMLPEEEHDEERSRSESVTEAREAWHYALLLDQEATDDVLFRIQAETC